MKIFYKWPVAPKKIANLAPIWHLPGVKYSKSGPKAKIDYDIPVVDDGDIFLNLAHQGYFFVRFMSNLSLSD